MSSADLRHALTMLVVVVVVWVGYGAIQGEELQIVRAVVLGACVAAGVLLARSWKNARAARR